MLMHEESLILILLAASSAVWSHCGGFYSGAELWWLYRHLDRAKLFVPTVSIAGISVTLEHINTIFWLVAWCYMRTLLFLVYKALSWWLINCFIWSDTQLIQRPASLSVFTNSLEESLQLPLWNMVDGIGNRRMNWMHFFFSSNNY